MCVKVLLNLTYGLASLAKSDCVDGYHNCPAKQDDLDSMLQTRFNLNAISLRYSHRCLDKPTGNLLGPNCQGEKLIDLGDSMSQLSLLQSSLQVDLNALPIANYDYGFPATDALPIANYDYGLPATDNDIMANQFVHLDASVPYKPARHSLLSRWSRGEAPLASKYVIPEAKINASPRGALSRLPGDAIVNAGRNDMDRLNAELASLNTILDTLRAEGEMVLPPFAHMAQDVPNLKINSLQQQGEQLSARSANVITDSMASSDMPFSPLWFLVVALVLLVVAAVVRVLMFGGGEKQLKEDGEEAIEVATVCGRLCCYFRPELHFMNFFILLFIVGGFWGLWVFKIIQPILSQMLCYVYFMICILLLVTIAYYELRYEIIEHIKPEYEKLQAVFEYTAGSVKEVETEVHKLEEDFAANFGLDSSKGKTKKGCC